MKYISIAQKGLNFVKYYLRSRAGWLFPLAAIRYTRRKFNSSKICLFNSNEYDSKQSPHRLPNSGEVLKTSRISGDFLALSR